MSEANLLDGVKLDTEVKPVDPVKVVETVKPVEVKPVEPVKPVVAEVKPVEEPKKAEDIKDDKAKVVPEKYEFKLPEGVTLDQGLYDKFTPLAKEIGLSQEQAQKLIDLQTEAMTNSNKAQVKAWEDMQTDWKSKTTADPEVGGANLQANLGHAKAFLGKYGTPALLEVLNTTGVGNNVELIRVFTKAGKAMSEDKIHVAGQGPMSPQDKAKVLFPNQN